MRVAARPIVGWLALVFVGCGGDAAMTTEPHYDVVVDDDGALVMTRDAVELVRIAPDDLVLGLVEEGADYNFDPWWLADRSTLSDLFEPPRGLRWLTPTDHARDDDGLTLSFDDTHHARLSVVADPADAGHYAVRFVPDGAGVAYLRVSFTIEAATRFYGLGNQHDRPELHGKRVALQLEPDPALETFYNERHVTTPLLVAASATSGWGVLFASDRPGVIDVAAKDPTKIEATFGIGVDHPGEPLPFDLFVDAHPLDIYRHYYALTGPPHMPADWAYGPWLWRDETPGQGRLEAAPEAVNAGVLQDLATIRALDLPTSGYWIDRPYASALQTFDFDPARYDDAAAMIATAQQLGFRVALWHTPYMTAAAGDLYQQTLALEAFPPMTGIALNGFGSQPIDFTRPAAVAFWAAHIAVYTALGVEGYKLDFGEDVVPGLPGARANVWQFADGSDERTMHARYAALYHAPYLAAMPSDGGFILARAAGRGGHTHVDVVWPGDLDADFATHGARPDGAAQGRVGGIPAALSYHLSVAASGFPFFAADTGGYRNGPPSAEAYSRWFEMTALAPVMQVGGDDNQVPWELERFGFDAALLDRYRDFARLHMRLFPFFRSEAARLLSDGRPIVRAYGLAHPELGRHPADEYFLGDALLVAPVVVDGATTRTLELPPGRWIDWWDGAARVVAEGGETLQVEAPLGRPPLFIAEGSMVPMLRPGVDTLAPVAAEHAATIDSAGDVPGRLWVRVVRGRDASYELHDGGRLTLSGDAITWQAGSRYGPGVVLELLDDDGTRVSVAGRALAAVDAVALADGRGWRRDGRVVWVALDGPDTVQIE